MARYTGPVCRLCRREGTKLFLKGTKCFIRQMPDREAQLSSRPARQGPQGQDRGLRPAAAREAEGQAHLLHPGRPVPRVLREGQPRTPALPANCCSSSWRRRLDNVAYRLGFAISRRQARQVVRHGHVQVNGRKVNIPSFQVNVGDEIAIREGSQEARHPRAGRTEFAAARTRCQRGSRSIATIYSGRFSRCRSAKTSTCRSTSS